MRETSQDKRRPLWVDAILLALAGAVFLCFVSLGNWQVRRLIWKTDLIERVDVRVNQAPQDLPVAVTREDHEYFRVHAEGIFLHEHERKVQAVTDLGPGYWILTPLQLEQDILWVNRGYVPNGMTAEDWTHPIEAQEVIGLVRITEPEGAFLQENDPENERWLSRDVEALSAKAGFETLPYFIDAEHTAVPQSWPRGGLTVISFRNSHLSYALTWYAMALLFFGMMAFVVVQRVRGRPLD